MIIFYDYPYHYFNLIKRSDKYPRLLVIPYSLRTVYFPPYQYISVHYRYRIHMYRGSTVLSGLQRQLKMYHRGMTPSKKHILFYTYNFNESDFIANNK